MSKMKDINSLSGKDQVDKQLQNDGKRRVSQIKTFNLNFQQLILACSFNELFVLDGNQSLSAIDVLQGHNEDIIAFDVSQMQKIIASISHRHLVIHCLVDSEPAYNFLVDQVSTKITNGDKLDRYDYINLIKNRNSAQTGQKLSFEPLQDFAVYTGMLKWIQTYKVELSPEMPVQTLSISQMGDFLVLAGYQNLAVWTQEAQFDTYMQQILYTKEEKPNQYAQVKEELESLTGEIVQVQICGAGRLIFSLEKGQRTLKIWHQEQAMIKSDKEPEIKIRKQQFNPLEVYELPKPRLRRITEESSKFAIDRFQILHKEFNSLWIVPTVIVTVSEGIQEASIWVEQLTEQSLAFSCIKVVTTQHYSNLKGLKNIFDAQFLQVTQYMPKQQVEKVDKYNSSPLFEAQRDKELYFKKIYQPKNEIFGIVPSKFKPRPQMSQNTNATLLDWLLIMSGGKIEIYKCSGLRNFPQRVLSVDLDFIIQLPNPLQQLFQPAYIQNAYCKSFNDKLNLLCTNQNGQLCKLWCDLKDNKTEIKLESSNMFFNSDRKVSKILAHPQLPVVALIYKAVVESEVHQIQFFLQKEHSHPLHGRPEMQYLGNYLSSQEIVSAKWIPDTLHMLVLAQQKQAKVSVITHQTIFKLGGLIEDIEKLQQELTKLSTTLSPNGLLHEIEPQVFEEVLRVQLDLQPRVQDIFVVNHAHISNKQIVTFAAITQNGKQQLNKVSWDVDGHSAVNTILELIDSCQTFSEGFGLEKILATNEEFLSQQSSYVLAITSKQIEQQAVVGQRRTAEKKPQCKIMLIQYTQQKIQERFCIEGIAEELLERSVQAKFGQNLLGIVLSQGNFHTEGKNLYIYDQQCNKYKGYLDLSAIIQGQTKHITMDFVFLEGKNRAAIALFVNENVYLIGEKEKTWGLEKKIQSFFNFLPSTISSLQFIVIQNEYKNCFVGLINSQHILPFNDGEILSHENTEEVQQDLLKIGNFREQSLHRHFVQSQRSMPLFNANLLEALYIKGYSNLVVKLLVMMFGVLKMHVSSSVSVSDYIDMDLQTLIIELKIQSEAFILAQGGGSLQADGNSSKKKAFSAFDDLDDNSESEEEKKEKGDEVEKKDYPAQFKENSDELLELLQQRAMITLGLQKSEILDLISFVCRFRNIFEKEFYSDSLSSSLLRKIFAQSEKVDEMFMETAKKTIEHHNEPDDETDKVEETKEVAAFTMEEFMAQKIGQTKQSSGELSLCKDWTSEMVAQALHSENQDVILDTLSERFNFDQNLTWSLMRRLSIPLWVKNVSKLKQLIEIVVKNEYRLATGDEGKPKAESSAIWYILLGKLAILQKLYKVEHGQEKFSEFFSKNFTDSKVRTIAGKNAMALVPKKKFHLACGFFLLANDLHGAIQIAINRTMDTNLAVLMCKIHDPQNETKEIDLLLTDDFIKRGETLNDPYLINIGLWLKKDFVKAVNMLAPEKEDDCLTYIFKNTQFEFNLCPDMQRPKEDDDFSKAPYGQTKEDEFIIYPLISEKSYIILDLFKKLQKAPDVKRMLNKDWTLDKKKGQKSIFDDFLGSGSESSEEKEEKESITVQDAKVLSFAVEKTIHQRFTILGLLLLEENVAIRKKIEPEQKFKLAKTILLDLIVSFVNQKDQRQQAESVQAVLKLLAETLQISEVNAFEFILKTCKELGLIKLEVEMLSQGQDNEGLQDNEFSDLERILAESQRLSGFILKCSRFGGFSLDSSDIDITCNERMYELICFIQKLIDCLILQSCKIPREVKHNQPKSATIKSDFFDDEDQEGNIKEQSPIERPKITEVSQIKNQSKVVAENWQNQSRLIRSNSNEEPDQFAEKLKLQKIVQLRFHSLILILTSMFHISLICNKHHLVKQIVVYITTLLGISCNYGPQFADRSITIDKIQKANELLQFQSVKTMATQIKNTLERNLKWGQQSLQQVKDQAQLGDFTTEIRRRKLSRDIEPNKNQIHYQFFRIWLRCVCVMQLQKIQKEKSLKELQFDHSPQKQEKESESSSKSQPFIVPKNFEFSSNKINLISIKKAIFNYEQDFDLLQLVDSLEGLKQSLEEVSTHIFQHRLTLKEQFCFVNDLENFFKNRYLISNGQIVQGKYFFPNEVKFKDFGINMDLNVYSILLKEHHLSLIKTQPGGDNAGDYNHDTMNPYQNQQEPRSGSPTKANKSKNMSQSAVQDNKKSNINDSDRNQGSGTESYVNSKFSTGIEIFKQRGEVISDFCFDQCRGDLLAFAMQARGMREISVQNTLLYRNRTAQGFDFIDEELFTWSDCLHRYDQISFVHNKLKPKTDSIKAAVTGLFSQPSSFGSNKIEKQRSILLLDQEINPQATFGGDESKNYLMSYSNLDITHDDYSNAIESHPKLPLYVTGNAKGLLCLWNFGQLTDKSLNQWILDSEIQPAQANPKKSTVRKIAFSQDGDKIAALNMEGIVYMMNFDLFEYSKQNNVFNTNNLARNKEFRANDFQFLDSDTVVACCSLKDKVLQIIDTLMPPKHSVVMTVKAGGGGNLMTVNSNKQKIYCFNSKPGLMNEYDIRMMKDTVNSLSLSKEEITAATIDPFNDALVVGYNDGIVKIYDETTIQPVQSVLKKTQEPVQLAFNARETINAFTTAENKKKPVTQLKIHPDNGGLFGSSAGGIIKLLRLHI